jgi:PAS domain S-box-containing protein
VLKALLLLSQQQSDVCPSESRIAEEIESLRQTQSSSPQRRHDSPHEPFWLLAVIFGALTIGIGLAGYRFASMQETRIQQSQNNELLAVAASKANAIAAWRRERLADAHLITENRLTSEPVRSWLKNKSSSTLKSSLVQWLNLFMDSHEYKDILLLDTSGAVVLATGTAPSTFESEVDGLVWQSVISHQVVFSDIHQDSAFVDPHIEIIAPLRMPSGPSGKEETFGSVALIVDPSDFLFPLIESWPSGTRTSETVLVRRDGDSIVYMLRTHFGADGQAPLKLPLAQASLPAAMAVKGVEGIAEGLDYRGIPVVAALKKIPESPWFIVAKIDRSEAFEDARTYAAYVASVTFMLILVAGLAILALWRRQRLRSILRLLKAETERKALTKHYEYLTKYANDIILMSDDKGKLVEVNERAVSSYGYSRDELLHLNLFDLAAPGSRSMTGGQIGGIKSEGGQVFDSVHRRKDGSTFPVEISARSIDIDGSEFSQSIVRDITERKIAEDEVRKSLLEKEILLKEVHHRVKNNLQVVSSLLSMEGDRVGDPRVGEFLKECRGRIRSMASVHEKLYRSTDFARIDFGEYLTSLTAEIMGTVKDERVSCSVEADGTHIEIDKAIPCGLIVNELVTNALKHGFPEQRAGSIKISFHKQNDGTMVLIVEDDGVGYPAGMEFENLGSLGMTLVGALVDQISGTFSSQRNHGSRFVIGFKA